MRTPRLNSTIIAKLVVTQEMAVRATNCLPFAEACHLVVGRYGGLYAYAPHAMANAAAMVVAAPIPYIGHDLTPFYNLAPGCPLGSNTPGHTNQIC